MKSLRVRVWGGTAAVVMICAGAVDLADVAIFAPRFEGRSLSLALAFAFVQTVAIIVFVGGLFARKWIHSRQQQQSIRIEREIQEALALHSLGQDQLPRLRSLMAHSRRDVEQGIAAALATLLSEPRARVAAASAALGMPQPDERQRLDALFVAAAAGNLRRRAILVEELEPHALALASDQLPRALASSDSRYVAAALDMLRAWKRMLTVANMDLALHHPEAAVRVRALQALPYVTNASHTAVGQAFRDASAPVRAAAAAAAGKLRLSELTDALVRALSDPAREVASQAAFALAALPDGAARLHQVVSSGSRLAAGVAFEALEKVTLGRLERV